MSLWVVVGGQYGSEGKGKISAFITKHEEIDICVRCGGPNSGHSFVDEYGATNVLRQLPTGFIRSKTRLLIPAGALVDLEVLRHEIETFNIPAKQIGVDPDSFVIDARDRDTERALKLQDRLSSTQSGVGSAVARRVLRGSDARLARDLADQRPWLRDLLVKGGVSVEVNSALDEGKKVLIEGTQGFGLSLYHSGHYPKCTSRDTSAAGFLSEVGVSPLRVTEIVVVFRTFPIRVAGDQAGPLQEEITWNQLQKESGCPSPIEEYTTVTRRLRRVARFDWNVAQTALTVNRPTRLAINGLDYINYANRGIREFDQLTVEAKDFVHRISALSSCKISYLGTGPSLDETLFRMHDFIEDPSSSVSLEAPLRHYSAR